MFQKSPYTVIKADLNALAAHVFEFESKPYHVFCKAYLSNIIFKSFISKSKG